MSVIGKRLRIGQVHFGGRPLRVDDFKKSRAATLISVEPCFEHTVGILEHAAAIKLETLDCDFIPRIGVSEFLFNLQLRGTKLQFGLRPRRARRFEFTAIAPTRKGQIDQERSSKGIVCWLGETAGPGCQVRVRSAHAEIGNQIDVGQFDIGGRRL